MTKEREVLQQALEALNYIMRDLEIRANLKHGEDKGVVELGNGAYIQGKEAIAAISDVLAQPEQNHLERLCRIMGTFDLATGHADSMNEALDALENELRDVLGHYREALKVQPEPMTYGCHCDLEQYQIPDGCVIDSDERHNCVYANNVQKKEDCEYWKPIRIATPAQPEQEPVNLLDILFDAGITLSLKDCDIVDAIPPLYTTPQAREWIDLENDEIAKIAEAHFGFGDKPASEFRAVIETICLVRKKMREKNA